MHGGSVRRTGRSRYRQWMTHKLSTWIDQFGTSGCVGCGRCITWCPVAIDITEEVAAIRADDLREDCMRRLRTPGELPALQPLAPEHRETIAGCARNRVFDARRAAPARGRARPTRSSSSATAPWRSRPQVPGRGRGRRSRRCTTATCSAGRGWCRRTATAFDARSLGTTHVLAFDGACLRGKCEADPALGYDLLKLIAAVFVERLAGHAAAAARPLREGRGDG